MIWLGAAWAAEGSAGAIVGAVASGQSAAPIVAGQLGAWVAWSPRPWGVAAEVFAWRHTEGAKPYEASSLYRFDSVYGRAAAFLEVALGTHDTTFHFGVGPALSAASRRVRGGVLDVSVVDWSPGLASRLALDGRLGPLGWTWRVGAASRGSYVDLDAGLGLGVAW